MRSSHYALVQRVSHHLEYRIRPITRNLVGTNASMLVFRLRQPLQRHSQIHHFQALHFSLPYN